MTKGEQPHTSTRHDRAPDERSGGALMRRMHDQIHADKPAWRLSRATGRPAAAQASVPRWFHEMSKATVPAHYIRSLEDVEPSPGKSTIVWGVQLPATAKQAIASLTRQRQGGALLIRADGQVLLED